jgi:hypothetical protein
MSAWPAERVLVIRGHIRLLPSSLCCAAYQDRCFFFYSLSLLFPTCPMTSLRFLCYPLVPSTRKCCDIYFPCTRAAPFSPSRDTRLYPIDRSPGTLSTGHCCIPMDVFSRIFLSHTIIPWFRRGQGIDILIYSGASLSVLVHPVGCRYWIPLTGFNRF